VARELRLGTEDLAPLPALFWPEEAFEELLLTGFEAALGVEVAFDAVGDFFFAALFD